MFDNRCVFDLENLEKDSAFDCDNYTECEECPYFSSAETE